MLRSGARRLSRGVATAANPFPSENASIAACWYRQLLYSSASLQLNRRSTIRRPSARFAAHFSTADFPSDSYFSASQPDHPSPARHPSASQLERFLPPLVDLDLIAIRDAHRPLIAALQHLDADLAWHLYKQLGKARRSLPTSVIDLLITLQCRKPVRSSPDNVIDSRLAVRQVCDGVLVLCSDRTRSHQAASSSKAAPSLPDKDGISTLSAAVSLRLLYLLVVEEEQIAASKRSSAARRRNNLSSTLAILLANVQAQEEPTEKFDGPLRGRLAATLSRVGATDAAYDQLKYVVEQAALTDDDLFIDPRPFDQLLSALARKAEAFPHHASLLPSPVDMAYSQVDEHDPIIRALRLTLSSEVPASKAIIHKCLQALDSATLWWLLPFELDGKTTEDGRSPRLFDDRFSLKPKWHPWQSSTNGASMISQDSLDSFAERVALVLAQRGILQPALHIVEGLQLSHSDAHAQHETLSMTKTPDHDLFTVLLEKLAERMASDSGQDARTSLDTHRGLSLDLHLAMKVYTAAHSASVDLDSRLNQAIIKALASCLPTAVADLGPRRSRFTKIKTHITQRNEQRGSKQALRVYLRQFADMLLTSDPDLSKGSLSYPAQATLLGLHMRTRDYAFTKRLYQLIRIREPTRQLWSSDTKGDSLQSAALDPLAGPDQDTFMWLFAESLRSPARTVFAVQLYFDWLASGHTLPSSLNAIFVKGLLRAGLLSVVQRVLQQWEGDRALLTAGLARSLVLSFADAGFPDLAMELVVNVSQATASTHFFQNATADVGGSDDSGEAWRLVSSLKLMSIALDRSSRVAAPDFGDLDRRVLRLFEEFRLGLTHHLCMNMSQRAESAQTGSSSSGLTLRDVRMAYNASMRASLSVLPSPSGVSTTTNADASEADCELVRSTCVHVEELFGELKDLVAEPDSDSWNLRLTAHLHACLAAPSQAQRASRLQTATEMLERTYGQTFRTDGDLQATEPEAHDLAPSMKARGTRPVEVHAAVVAAAMDASRLCGDLESGLHVYQLHMRHSDPDTLVEKARLLLLADLAEPRQWRNELDRLLQRSKSVLGLNDDFLKQLQTLSNAATQRTATNAFVG
ncbi:hypothetical protein PSEUBRA_002359 [Kalmanozyma brasiliensis GHG001]|uniref:uncharacterized protein n=1 Tax=Kalmanozyma brasiliensis (strain GHG001) TaxID=1365824 RepID=UPI001CE89A43|nr:uncharacterized protein PSEUBRA_002359 [Kalmanozyma brasiliensis GHG001]EST07974.2 hypothetical protein PSEUBRA_002359 [Kalmanozyma brasiliensis GHG001]